MKITPETTVVTFDQIQADDSDNIVAGNGSTLMGITGTLMALCFSVVMMRCWARQVILRTFGLDDVATLLALGFAIVGFVSFVGLCRAGGGRRADELTARQQSDFKLYSVLIGLCCVTGICLVKISVGFFLRRFLVSTRLLRVLVDGFIAFMAVFTIYSILTFALICMPLASYWDASITGGTCWDARTMEIVGNLNAALNVTTDAFTWLLPLQVIIKLQVNRRTKISLVIIMSLGLLSIVASVARVVFGSAWQWSTDLYLWLNIEVTIAILSASLPCLRPIFKSFLGTTADPSPSSYFTTGPTGGSSAYGPGRTGPGRSRLSTAVAASSRRRSGYARQPEGVDIALQVTSGPPRSCHPPLPPSPSSRKMADDYYDNENENDENHDASYYGFHARSSNNKVAYETQVSVSIVAGAGADERSPVGMAVGGGDDHGSEDEILPRPLVGGITKTTEIFISKA